MEEEQIPQHKTRGPGWGGVYLLIGGFLAFAAIHQYLYYEQKKRDR